jgi:hypothetical protein
VDRRLTRRGRRQAKRGRVAAEHRPGESPETAIVGGGPASTRGDLPRRGRTVRTSSNRQVRNPSVTTYISSPCPTPPLVDANPNVHGASHPSGGPCRALIAGRVADRRVLVGLGSTIRCAHGGFAASRYQFHGGLEEVHGGVAEHYGSLALCRSGPPGNFRQRPPHLQRCAASHASSGTGSPRDLFTALGRRASSSSAFAHAVEIVIRLSARCGRAHLPRTQMMDRSGRPSPGPARPVAWSRSGSLPTCVPATKAAHGRPRARTAADFCPV